MSACEAQIFGNITETVWERLLEKAESYGIGISGHSGESARDGFTVTWNYDSTAQTLHLQCTESPWYAPCSMINEKVQELVEKCRGE